MLKLYNGDCREVIEKNWGGWNKTPICIVTDPPFNIGYHYNTYNDKLTESEYATLLKDVFVTHDVPLVCVHYPEQLYKVAHIIGKYPMRVVSWVYNSNTRRQHRDVAFFDIMPDFKKVTQPYKNPNDKRIQERIKNGSKGTAIYDWWNINQVKNVSKEKTAHPCQMPLEVMKNIIGVLPDNYTILDPFMGSGTTGVACKELGRDFIGIEIDEKYFDIAKQRLDI